MPNLWGEGGGDKEISLKIAQHLQADLYSEE